MRLVQTRNRADLVQGFPDRLERECLGAPAQHGRHEPGSSQGGLPFENFPADGDRRQSLWQCHNLEHEDNEMMRPYEVV